MKAHLCQCLDEYNEKILDLKQQLEEHSKNAELLRKQQRKQRNKHITINPSQMCDLCFTNVFRKEFFVFPCLHTFHRECVFKALRNYETKDPKVRVVVEKVKSLFGEIENIKQRAVFIQQSQTASGSMFGGAFGLGGTAEDEMKKSYISDIRNFFTKSMKGGMVGGVGAANQQVLAQKDQEDIRRVFNKIDEILTRECFYCGSILIDMVDNDIFLGNEAGRDYEFFSQEEAQQIAALGEEEWKIQ